ncbi:S-type anion channel SLAH3-like, partial [Argentina anserina]|uniref:S-type anion channel SLAH3-like n=1 Tax=Argentina anserina TaxID=57926 RepID=UPI00217652AE
LKIYGQWMLGGERGLSKVANPVNHISIVGNFVGALLGASMALREGPIFIFAVGLAHYSVLFVTLYQKLTTNESVIPKELHPVFFLFVAAPSVASMAWAKIQGTFDHGSRICYFIAMFLYLSSASIHYYIRNSLSLSLCSHVQVVGVNFFRGFKFSLAWWAYTFPMTGAAIATIRYSNEVMNVATQALAVILSLIATLTVLGLFVVTILHAFVLRDLFPNDIAIAISDTNPSKLHKKWHHLKQDSSSCPKDIENSLK